MGYEYSVSGLVSMLSEYEISAWRSNGANSIIVIVIHREAIWIHYWKSSSLPSQEQSMVGSFQPHEQNEGPFRYLSKILVGAGVDICECRLFEQSA